jgi:hypothetical protein
MNITKIITKYTNSSQSNNNNATLEQNNAAQVIQKHTRIYLKKKGILSNNLLSKYKTLCIARPKELFKYMPRATTGATKVFLPKDFPKVIFKQSGKASGEIRLRIMQKVRDILTRQKSSCLIIPKAIRFGDFLVEDRLPINTDSFHNMALYISHTKLFDDAVREMTKLFSENYLTDLITYCSRQHLGHILGVGNSVRYDNLPLFIVESHGIKKGAIGLIDLEHLSERQDNTTLKTLVRIFPYHLNIIKQEADSLKMIYDNKELEEVATQGRKYLQLGYTDFLNWLQIKGISNNPKNWKFEINRNREKEFRDLIELELIKLNQGINDLYKRDSNYHAGSQISKYYLKEDIVHSARELSYKITPAILNDIVNVINESLISKIEKYSRKIVSIPDEATIVALRSLSIMRAKFFWSAGEILDETDLINHEKCSGFIEKNRIAEQLFHIIFKKLVDYREIFYYDPGYNSRSITFQSNWIRF